MHLKHILLATLAVIASIPHEFSYYRRTFFVWRQARRVRDDGISVLVHTGPSYFRLRIVNRKLRVQLVLMSHEMIHDVVNVLMDIGAARGCTHIVIYGNTAPFHNELSEWDFTEESGVWEGEIT